MEIPKTARNDFRIVSHILWPNGDETRKEIDIAKTDNLAQFYKKMRHAVINGGVVIAYAQSCKLIDAMENATEVVK